MDFKSIFSKRNITIGVISALSIYVAVTYFDSETKGLSVNKTEPAVWDKSTEDKIKQLHPSIQNRARAFINEAYRQGYKVRITSSFRSYADQEKIYAQGRTTDGYIITNAKAGYSWHNFGLAFDTVPMENGKPNYKSKNWEKIADIGKSFGFEWGGDWKNFIDKPHFQDRFGMSTADARAKKKEGVDYIEIEQNNA